MSIVRTGLFEFRGQDAPVLGADILLSQQAPEFTVQGVDWSLFRGMGDTQGKVRIIGSLPSLGTSVCDRETRRFNQEAGALGEDIVIMMVSMDLPYTIKNWCGAAGVDKVITLSDHLTGEFGEKYGVLLKDQRIFRRAIFVVDRKGKVVYADYMPKIGDEPNYEQVLAMAKEVL